MDTLTGHSCGTLLSLTSDMPRLHQHVSGSPVARRIAHALSTKAAQICMALRHHGRNFATRSAHTLEAIMSYMVPPIIPLTSDTPRLHQYVSRSPVARRHANALSTKAAQIPMALRHHERRVAHDLPTHYKRFVRDFLQKSCVQSPKRAFRTRLPPTVTRQVFHMSVSYETSSKTHTSKSAKRALRTRLPPKVKRKHPSEHTHHAALPSSFSTPAPPNNTGPHANPNVTATLTSTAQSTAPATKSETIVSCELQQYLHHTTRLE